jgi:hypothetical protein
VNHPDLDSNFITERLPVKDGFLYRLRARYPYCDTVAPAMVFVPWNLPDYDEAYSDGFEDGKLEGNPDAHSSGPEFDR